MAKPPNFLLGRGERLTEPVVVAGRPVTKIPPYSFVEARARVQPMVNTAVRAFDQLPGEVCPHDETVASLTLNPEFTSKSSFPDDLLKTLGLRLVGSRGKPVIPEQRSRGREPVESQTTELFVAGTRRAYHDWMRTLPSWSADTRGADQLAAVERLAAPNVREKVKPIHSADDELFFEIVLHASGFKQDAYILEAFEAFIESQDLEVNLDRRIHAGGLCFVGLQAPKKKIENVARFSFLRIAREMPRLRMLRPMFRSAPASSKKPQIPSGPALDPSIKVAVFDGGMPEKSPLLTWVKREEVKGIGASINEGIEHGHGVTSALLFGSIAPGEVAQRPYANVTHYRVVDEDSEDDPSELYDVLERIRSVLSTQSFHFVNFSIGPQMPIDDGDVHPWTAVLDDYLADGSTLAAVAVGNDGKSDPASGLNRIQVPSDCVNALAVGSADCKDASWDRAPYSSVGPGRSPGIVKPDVLGFGGSDTEPYGVLKADTSGKLNLTQGTSFASPHVLRTGIGLRAHFGQALGPLAIKALLVHSAEFHEHSRHEVGWGRVPELIEEIVTCPDGMVRVVYQGELTPSKYLRAALPLPAGPLTGKVKIAATFCYATETDPAHPSNYTRSGLEIVFRPNDSVRDVDAMHPKTTSFFSPRDLYPNGSALRRDAHKWETCLHASITKRGSSLKNPVFDIHYSARSQGQADRAASKIPYALIITIEAPSTKDLYDRVVRRYRTLLEPLKPLVQVPVRNS